MNTEHMSAPWRLYKPSQKSGDTFIHAGGKCGLSSSFICIASVGSPNHSDEQNEANAAFIVRACNAHEALLTAAFFALTHEDGPDVRDALRKAVSLAGGIPDDFDLTAALARLSA